MHPSASFVFDLAIVLGVAAVISLVFHRLRQPPVLGHLLAGIIVGPYIPIPLFADPHRVHELAEFGIILVMFAIGLELRLARLVRVLPSSGLTAAIQISALLWAGFSLGRALDWSITSSLFLGAAVSISSTMLVTKIFEQTPVDSSVRSHVFGVLVLQDIAAVAFITALTLLAAGEGLDPDALGREMGKLVVVLAVLVIVGLLIIPRLFRVIVRQKSAEVLVVGAMGTCFTFAVVAEALGFSVALGAFVAGVVVAESGHRHEVEHAIAPIKNMFTAVFFVSIGMTVDPATAIGVLPLGLFTAAMVISAQFISVIVGGVFSGQGLRRSLIAGVALGQIGEFAFVMAGIGTGAGVVPDALQPLLVTVAVVTAFTTPLMLGMSERLYAWIDHRLPRRIHVLLLLYEAWFARLGQQERGAPARPLRRVLVTIVVDAFAIFCVIEGILWQSSRATDAIIARANVSNATASALLALGALAVLTPLLLALLRNTRRLERVVSEALLQENVSIPSGAAVAAARVLRFTLLLVVLFGAGSPGIALVRPLLSAPYGAPLLLLGLAASAVMLWRAAGDLQGQTASGFESLLGVLDRQRAPAEDERLLASPYGSGAYTVRHVRLQPGNPSIGKTLRDVNLRALTGATVIAIVRARDKDTTLPIGTESLESGDELVLAGPLEAVTKAQALLAKEVATAQ